MTLVLMAMGLGGLILTALGLPGIWLFLLATGGLKLAGLLAGLGWTVWLIGLLLALVAEIIEWVVSLKWADRYGGTKRAGWGALLGGLLGALVGVPVPIVGPLLGSFAGSFVGAWAFELAGNYDAIQAGRSAWGALLGRAVATAAKLGLGVVIVVLVIGAAWS